MKLYKLPCWDSLKATLFGKFYEAIVANYFKYELEYEVYDQNISIPIINEWLNELDEQEFKDKVYDEPIKEEILIKILKKINSEIKKLKKGNRRRFNPDIIVEKNNKYYVVEMQVWPVWLKRRYHEGKLTWKVIIEEVTAVIPRVIATKVKIMGKEYPVSGFYYV